LEHRRNQIDQPKMSSARLLGSFRDPAGFVFKKGGGLYRQVNSCFRDEYEHLMGSGLYEELIDRGLLVSHEETDMQGLGSQAYMVVKPDIIPFISYPYEWSFGQLQAAALATLEVLRVSLDYGMILKDASAYNIQFKGYSPIFIDTLSFRFYQPGEPWVAYRQFCQHFLAPLALMSHIDARLGLLLRAHLNGIPLDLTTKLLPWTTRLQSGLLIHLHLHAERSNRQLKADEAKRGSMDKKAMLGLIGSLSTTVKGLKPLKRSTEWVDYYKDQPSYKTLAHKDAVVEGMAKRFSPATIWDLGANTGRYTWLAAKTGATAVALEGDGACAQALYEESVARRSTTVLPLVMNLVNPSPALGSECTERRSLFQRGPADLVMMLALLHHLVIRNNLPVCSVARMVGSMGRSAIVEYIPPTDPMAKQMLAGRDPRAVHGYNQQTFERDFSEYFVISHSVQIESTQRRIYLLTRR